MDSIIGHSAAEKPSVVYLLYWKLLDSSLVPTLVCKNPLHQAWSH